MDATQRSDVVSSHRDLGLRHNSIFHETIISFQLKGETPHSEPEPRVLPGRQWRIQTTYMAGIILTESDIDQLNTFDFLVSSHF